MFFPLADANRSRSTPRMTIALIGINFAIFIWQVLSFHKITEIFALYPDQLLGLLSFKITRVVYLPGLITHMFLHASLLHLLGNMLFLWIFGDNVEDNLGPIRFLKFYLLCGLVAALSQTFLSAGSGLPMVGASGAIAGVLGAYFILYPKAKVTTLILIFIRKMPAAIFLGLWLAFQIIYSIMYAGRPGVAWYAHIGGFIAGMLLIKPFKKLVSE